MKVCVRCKQERPRSDFGSHRRTRDRLDVWCKPCRRVYMQAYMRVWGPRRPRKPRIVTLRSCGHCGAQFEQRGPKRFCSRRCQRRVAYDRGEHDRRRAVRRTDKPAERLFRSAVFERDHWICQLCGDRVDRSWRFPDPRSPSLDHVVPLARGGGHTLENVQLAHLGCNSRKGATVLGMVA